MKEFNARDFLLQSRDDNGVDLKREVIFEIALQLSRNVHKTILEAPEPARSDDAA